MSKTTLDLSTLSDIADGTHTVKVKAKADGYIDSEFSNEVSYTKAPAAYSGEFTTYTSSATRPFTNVTVKYNGASYQLTPTTDYEVLKQQLNIKAGEIFSWEIDDNRKKIKVISSKNCTVISEYNKSGSAKPTGSDWQLSTSFI